MRYAAKILGRMIVFVVTMYRRLLSPLLPASCRYYPSCSSYMIEAVKLNGPFLGFVQGTLRIFRCNPLFTGGVDHPKQITKKVWKW